MGSGEETSTIGFGVGVDVDVADAAGVGVDVDVADTAGVGDDVADAFADGTLFPQLRGATMSTRMGIINTHRNLLSAIIVPPRLSVSAIKLYATSSR